MITNRPLSWETEKTKSCYGFCKNCQKEHYLKIGAASSYADRLINFLQDKKRIDFLNSDINKNSHFSTDYLFGQARGQMFGVMVYEDGLGKINSIPAFSGQYNGLWKLEGWAPPLFEVNEFNRLTNIFDPQIKLLSNEIESLGNLSPIRKDKIEKRKKISQKLMKDIHNLYRVHNFKGESCSIYEAFNLPNGVPTGAGDCCAPKLLNFAAVNNHKPLGLVEFFWGKENRSKTKQHGFHYSSCQDKCQPLLGFMLCGLS